MTWREAIESHYQAVWGAIGERCPFSAGPIFDLPLDFTVIKYPPHAGRSMWTYATCEMSQPTDQKPVELHMFCPWDSPQIVELLVATAHFHRTGVNLDLGHSVNFGRPWMADSNSEYGLVSLPYLDGPLLENLSVGSKLVKFYWLVPVTYSEIEFRKKNGTDALEEQFEKAGFDYLDPRRQSVV